MDQPHILMVEDDEDIQQLLTYNLLKAGFQVACAGSAEEGLQMLAQKRPALILLDLMLPRMDGLEMGRSLKQHPATSDIPLIMLTAKGEEEDIIKGLELGADDYITKPFSPKVVVGRIKAVLRNRIRKEIGPLPVENSLAVLKVHNLAIHPGRHEVVVEGERVELTFTEFGILHLLANRPGWVFTRQQVINAVHGYGYIVTSRAVDVQVFGLRKKLGKAGRFIETVRGIGYRMRE